MKINIEIECDNAAFGETNYEIGEELRRILDDLGQRLSENGPPEPGDPLILRDINGNHVGKAYITA